MAATNSSGNPGSTEANQGKLSLALAACRGPFAGVALFSGLINVLALTGSFYMLQVYDRVIPSHSVPTLIGLSVLMAGLYAANGLFEFIRSRILSRIGVRFDRPWMPLAV